MGNSIHADRLDGLRRRFQAGGPVSLADVFDAAGLTGHERHVIEQRLRGRSFGDIANDPELTPPEGSSWSRVRHLPNRSQTFTRQWIEMVERGARAKLGLAASIAAVVHQQQQAEGADVLAARANGVTAAELHAAEGEGARPPRQKLTARERFLLDKADKFLALAEVARRKGRNPSGATLAAMVGLAG